MLYPIITAICLLVAWPLGGSPTAVYLLVLGQLALLLCHILRGQVSAVGSFLFMSFLFFGIRAIYLITENDYDLLNGLFMVQASPEIVNNAVWWGTAAMLSFHLGGEAAPYLHQAYFRARQQFTRTRIRPPLAKDIMVALLLAYQMATLPVMAVLANAGRALYGSAFGAYVYDLPMVLQAGHVLALVIIFERWLRVRDPIRLIILGISGIMFLIVTWQMREVSMFRGFYVTGVMVAGIAILTRLKRRVSLLWIILPIILLQPVFRTLGETRSISNDELGELTLEERIFGDETALESLWSFYNSKGDINILDTFTAASVYQPKNHPYLLSWLYVPVHLVPRAIWSSKPEKGILQDVDFMRGAPYSPGIAGFFLLDGGFLWMLGCMALLGYLLSFIDRFLLTMPRSYLRCCLIAILVVNAMFLSRFYLWQSFYQILYAAIPCIALARYLDRRPLHEHFGGFSKPVLSKPRRRKNRPLAARSTASGRS